MTFRWRADHGRLLVVFGLYPLSPYQMKMLSELDSLWKNFLDPCMALLCVVFFVTFPYSVPGQVGTWLYRFLIIAFLSISAVCLSSIVSWCIDSCAWSVSESFGENWTQGLSNTFFKSCIVCNFWYFSIFFYFLFKSFVKVELSYVFTINLFTIAENCTEKWIIL